MTDLAARRAEAEAGRAWLDATNRLAILSGRITELRSALENYGRHFPWCERNADTPCNCGLDAEIAKRVKMPPELPDRFAETANGVRAEANRLRAAIESFDLLHPAATPVERPADLDGFALKRGDDCGRCARYALYLESSINARAPVEPEREGHAHEGLTPEEWNVCAMAVDEYGVSNTDLANKLRRIAAGREP